MELPGYRIGTYLTWWKRAKQFSKGIIPAIYILTNIWCLLTFLISVILVGVKQNLSVVLIDISLITSNIKHIVMAHR